MLRYALTTFLSAFLLFQVQPLLGKAILPWFGGTPGVWTACMLFFQVLLLCGYAYAHLVVAQMPRRWQGGVHAALLLVSLACLPILPAEHWKPTGDEAPTLQIVMLLAATIGLPYLMLSATGPLLQGWWATTRPGTSPYRLYALSNVGSLLALVSYPFVVEPALSLGTQARTWSIGYVIFTLGCATCAAGVWRAAKISTLQPESAEHAVAEQASPPTWSDILYWVALAATGSALLLATTNQMCQEVAVVPFLWVLPLGLYLLSFILCFEGDRWYRRGPFGVALACLVPVSAIVFLHAEAVRIIPQVVIYSLTMFVGAMVAHGELSRGRPHPRYLTVFYLMIAAGGATGGALVAVAAPRMFHGYWEYPLTLGAACLLAIVATRRERFRTLALPGWKAWAMPTALYGLLIGALGMQAQRNSHQVLESTRNFYGVLRVVSRATPRLGEKISMTHGRIEHGSQFRDAGRRHLATAMFGPTSGVALAITENPKRHVVDPSQRGLRIGVIGLGAGTLMAYSQPGDYVRYYEINPEVVRLARKHFTFLSDSPAQIDIVLGDARVQLERELDAGMAQNFDVLIVDAFTSDAIPMHLLTGECTEVYRRHLASDGILALHISNRMLDLKPVCRAMADRLGFEAVWVRSFRDDSQGTMDADCVLLTSSRLFLNNPRIKAARSEFPPRSPDRLIWTDDYGSLWQVLER
ncbi:MAG: fused MFS/spermidine synthase [Pirellulales bacterium]|nr:fused MFS/spermidine synthase [Pirellulales bacterium]